ncbi:MAG TPA: 4-hydroxy-tetrahydrodipicolinate synthase [Candidatus Paceibacterota bacterium]|nr:4-hydroxy-tetrahydrodipicolinate synthase [Candidatus Paceibacterota bacterium]
MKTTFHGVLVALVTPMKANGEIDFNVLSAHIEAMVAAGVHGLIPLGSTGEFYALAPDERREVIKATIKAASGRVPVVAGANASSTRDVVTFSREAEALGCDAVMLAPPYYSLPTPDELYAHYKAVNDAIGLPIMLYNYPGRTGVDMSPEFIERLCELPLIRYVKESTGEIGRISTLLRRCGDRLGVFCGGDTVAFESLALGAIGWVGGVANVVPRSHVELYRLMTEKRDFAAARKLYFQMLPLLNLMEGGGKYTQWVKAACGLVGRPAGAPRAPLRAPTLAELKELKAALSQIPETRQFRK